MTVTNNSASSGNTTTAQADRAGLLALDAEAQRLLFRESRTAHRFTDEPVTEEQIHAIQDLVKYGPTSANGQPLRVVWVRSPEARARLMPLLSPNNQVISATAPVVAILAADTRYHELLPRVNPKNPNLKEGLEGDEQKDARRLAAARLNALLQVGYFILGVRAAGLYSCPMTGFDAPGTNREFFADGRLQALVVINIGHPAPGAWEDPRLPRLDYEDVVITL